MPLDYHHNRDLEGLNRLPASLAEETARGMLFCMAENEFYLVGHKVRLFFTGAEPEDGSIPVNWLNGQHLAHNMESFAWRKGILRRAVLWWTE